MKYECVDYLFKVLKSDENCVEILKKYWESTGDLSEFVEEVFKNQHLINKFGYTDLSNKTDDYWYKVRKALGSRVFKTYSSAGGLKVGSGKMTLIIPNGNNSDETRTAIFKKGEIFDKHMMNYTGITLCGEIVIYEFDCGDKKLGKITGTYEAYCYDGMIALVEA